MSPVIHGSFTIERTYPYPPARVFRAWSDPAAKVAWFRGPAEWPQGPHTLDFREGGRESSSGGPVGGPIHRFEAVIHHIAPARAIVSTYEMYLGESRMSVSLASVEFHPAGKGTRLVYTEHVAFVDGKDGTASRREGTDALLGALGSHLEAESTDEICTSRVFDAPPAALFAAWSDPARLARWWGPDGFTSTFHAFDFRPGGVWRFTFRGPDGSTYENHWTYLTIVPNERILQRHDSQHRFTMDATFVPEGAGTRLTWVMRFEEATSDQLRAVVIPANEQNFDRLAAELKRQAALRDG
jgi:uncharacterized protein YndB with AHSA1/START domain